MKRTPLLGLALVLPLLVAGCGGGEPSADETPSPTKTSTPTATGTASATPTPTPSDAPAIDDPADTSTWLVDGTGVGPVDIGAARSGLGSLLPGWTLDPEMACDNHSYGGPTSMRILLSGDPVGIVVLASETPTAVVDSPHTAQGVELGATTAEVAAAYPGLPLVDNGYQSPHFVVPDAGRYVHIILDDDKVVSFFVTPYDSLPMDLC